MTGGAGQDSLSFVCCWWSAGPRRAFPLTRMPVGVQVEYGGIDVTRACRNGPGQARKGRRGARVSMAKSPYTGKYSDDLYDPEEEDDSFSHGREENDSTDGAPGVHPRRLRNFQRKQGGYHRSSNGPGNGRYERRGSGSEDRGSVPRRKLLPRTDESSKPTEGLGRRSSKSERFRPKSGNSNGSGGTNAGSLDLSRNNNGSNGSANKHPADGHSMKAGRSSAKNLAGSDASSLSKDSNGNSRKQSNPPSSSSPLSPSSKRRQDRRRTREKFIRLLLRSRSREAFRLALESNWKPTIVDINETIARLTKQKLIGVALEVIREAEITWKLLPPKNLKTATLMIDVYGKAKMLDKAIRTFEFAESIDGGRMTTISFNALVAACARSGRADLSFAVIDKMRIKGLKPDKFTFSAIIDALGKAGDVEHAFAVADMMEEEGIEMDQASYSALIDACGRAGRLDTAFLVFEDMKNSGVWPNVINFAVMIEACAGALEPEKAFEVFRELRQWNIKPNVVIYTCLLDGCCKARRMDKAEEVLMDMRANGIAPNTVTYGSIIHGYCACGDLNRAFGIVDTMIRERCAPSPKLIQSLVYFCKAYNRPELVRFVWDLHTHFPQSLPPSFFLKLMSMMAQMGEPKLGLEIARQTVHEYPSGGSGLRRSLTRAMGELLDCAEDRGDNESAEEIVHLLDNL